MRSGMVEASGEHIESIGNGMVRAFWWLVMVVVTLKDRVVRLGSDRNVRTCG